MSVLLEQVKLAVRVRASEFLSGAFDYHVLIELIRMERLEVWTFEGTCCDFNIKVVFSTVFEFKICFAGLATYFDWINSVCEKSGLLTRNIDSLAHWTNWILASFNAAFAEDILATFTHWQVFDDAVAEWTLKLFSNLLMFFQGIISRILSLCKSFKFCRFYLFLGASNEHMCVWGEIWQVRVDVVSEHAIMA